MNEFNALRLALGELAKAQRERSVADPGALSVYENAARALNRLSEKFEPR